MRGRTVGLVPTMGYFHAGPPVAHAGGAGRDAISSSSRSS